MKATIIFPVKNEGSNLQWTLDSLYQQPSAIPFEVIVVDDQSEDHCCDFLTTYKAGSPLRVIKTNGVGAANARNIGAEQANGDFLIFCDAHLLFEEKWLDRLLAPLEAGQTDAVSPSMGSIGNESFIGYGQTIRPNFKVKWNPKTVGLTETALLPGACLAISKETFQQVGGFERGFFKWGHEDVELSIKLWLFGFRCHIEPSIIVHHLFRKQLPYEVSYEDFYFNLLKIAYSHFNIERISKCKRLIVSNKLPEIERKLIANGALIQRQIYLRRRKRSDDWFFDYFQIDF